MRRGSAALWMAPVFGLVAAVTPSARAQLASPPTASEGGADLSSRSPSGPAAAAAPESRPMTVDECVALALDHNPDALSSDFDVASADAARAGVRGQFGPKLQADGTVQQYTSPYALQFASLGSFTVRDAFTWTFGATMTQPLTPLWSTLEQYKAQAFGVDIAAIKRIETRRQVSFDVVQSYYRLLESERLAEVAEASVTQLEAEKRQAQSNFANGVIAKNDLLRADLALANARQRSIQQSGAVVLARAQLAQSMGLAPAQGVEAVPFSGAPPVIDEVSLAAAEAHALARRPEVRELARSIDQAEAGVRYARTKLLPQLNVVGNYTHTAGSPFVQVNAAYVGLVGSWDVWDWGTTESAIAQADAQLHQARLARRKVEDQVRVEARQAFVNAQTARDALDVAKVAVSQAEENFRIVTKKFENAAATSFDVVDAEALLTQARGQVETALYDYLIARAALQRATGAVLPGGE
ncbi:MAG TPA: TolC family protein [Polyangiaceae bacterium]|nr:TolC family protein [Polyangiaceae bacterium]